MTLKSLTATLLAALCTVLTGTAVADGDAGPTVAAGPAVDCATLLNPVGRVLVNQGEEYVIARNGMPALQGDRIVTMDNSSVTVSYVTGAQVNLPENSQLLIEQCDAIAAPLLADTGAAPVAAAPVAGGVSATDFLPALAAIPILFLALDDDDDDDDDDDAPISPAN